MHIGKLTIFFVAICASALPAEDKKAIPPRDELEQAFIERMTSADLVGTFSVDRKPGAKAERYEIDTVEKLKGDDWVITARMKYGQNDVKLPIVVQVYWAGDTPMISLTDLTIPGLGTFTSRVMIHEDRYAGTWQHGEVGGHMWGMIEKRKDEKPAEEK